jgi:L-seryl-tRNA(Ser) seleniumtransferase
MSLHGGVSTPSSESSQTSGICFLSKGGYATGDRTHIMAEAKRPVNLRLLPSIDSLLKTEQALLLKSSLGAERLAAIARRVTDDLRRDLQEGKLSNSAFGDQSKQQLLNRAVELLESAAERERLSGMRRIINATGVILHTNLGRAPLSEQARRAITDAAGYCTLEYDSTKGMRGRRGENVERLLTEITGAEDALIVNNCAAAALLVLKALAGDGETIVSRGELVEIGGDFRVPDVMANSGTRMIEVGSTNRTHLDDYRKAKTDKSRLVMRVHPSNYRIVGFTTSPSRQELANFSHEANLYLYEDAGSGVLFDLSEFGLRDEPIIGRCIEEGADVVSFSGDKLLGGPQAGLIVGKHRIIQKLRTHSLYRALRADKLCLAALEATLESHLSGRSSSEVPALKMLAASESEIRDRAASLIQKLALASAPLRADLVAGESAIGGGCGPETFPRTALIALSHDRLSADEIEARLRSCDPPVICRIREDKALIDLRTVDSSEELQVLTAIASLSDG